MRTPDSDAVSPRRAFLGQLATGAAIAATGVASGSAFASAANAMPIDTEGSEPWLKGYTGKHKVIYDAPEPNDGFPLIFAYNYIDTMTKTYMLKPADTSVIVVLRHFGIPAAFGDAIWAKYKFGEMFKITDPATKAPSLRNIFLHSKAGDMLMPDASIDKVMAKGVKICVCNLALGLLSGKAADAMKQPHDAVTKEWIAGMVPGTFVVPSGVLAVARAQESGGTYCFAG